METESENRAPKCCFSVESKLQSLSLNGQFILDNDNIICYCGETVNVLCISTCKLARTYQCSDGEISCVALSFDRTLLATSHSAVIRAFYTSDGTSYRTWKHGHKGAVLRLAFSPFSNHLASGGSEGTVKIWIVESTTCTHLIAGNDGPISAISFTSEYLLFSNASTCDVMIYELASKKKEAAVHFHISVVTCIRLQNDETLVTSSRDGVLLFSRFPSGERLFTIQVFEPIESFLLFDDVVFTFGAFGRMRKWDIKRRCCLDDDALGLQSLHIEDGTHAFMFVEKNTRYIVISSVQGLFYVLDQDFHLSTKIIYSLNDVKELRCIGNETFAFTLGTDKIMALSRNSDYKVDYVSFLTENILSLDTCDNWLVGGTKSGSICLWQYEDGGKFTELLAQSAGHAGPVLSVSICAAGFIVSGSSDATFKLWKYDRMKLKSIATRGFHLNKEVSYTSYLPAGDKFATASSQDPSVYVWMTKDVSTAFVLDDLHKKNVIMIRFSRYSELLAVAYLDNALRIFCSNTGKCLQTIDGCELPVLSTVFLPSQFDIFCGDGNGLLRLWDGRACECKFTSNNVNSSVISLDGFESFIVCAYRNGTIEILKDVTEEKDNAERLAAEKKCMDEQALNNLLAQHRFLEAIKLCIEMDQPFRILNLLLDLMYDSRLQEFLKNLDASELQKFLKYLCKWNAFGRFSAVSQHVLHLILTNTHPSDLLSLPDIAEVIERLIPYTQRHAYRYNKLHQGAHILDFACRSFRNSTEIETETNNKV